ncbi:MAG: glutamate synthase-related protein, partial [Fidelibacterota bacterium]
MKPLSKLAYLKDIPERVPQHALVGDVDLVIIRDQDQFHVLYGRCLHRGALLSDGTIQGQNLVCGLHFWDYRLDSGVSEYNNQERLKKFHALVKDGALWIDPAEIEEWAIANPQPWDREAYQGAYQDHHGTEVEPEVGTIRELAGYGLSRTGHHGPTAAMGVPRQELPSWNEIQFVVGQLHTLPRLDDEPVATELVIGPLAKKPLTLDIPLFVSDMSYGALSEEAKIALARGAELAGTGICSGEGGMLPEEQAENSKYFYELASGRFGWSWEKIQRVQAFHFKGGQGAKTGTGGHLPGDKVQGKIAAVRGIPE